MREKYVDSLSGLFEWSNTLDFRILVSNAIFRVHMISAYSINAQAAQNKIKVEPSLTQRVRAMLACQFSLALTRARCVWASIISQ